MTINQIAIVAVVSGTCWTFFIERAIAHAANRIIKRMDELEKKLDAIESRQSKS
jgi:hypothetical protein